MELRPPLHFGVVAIERRAFGSPSTTVANFTYYTLQWNILYGQNDLPDSENEAIDKRWTRWFETFTNFIETFLLENPNRTINKRALLTNYVSNSINDIITDCESYEEAIERLHTTNKKQKHELFVQHVLATRWQEAGETLGHFLKTLRT